MTIVLDTSALVSIVFGEPEGVAFSAALRRALPDIAVSASTIFETRIVVEGRAGAAGSDNLSALLAAIDATVVPFDTAQSDIAIAAWRRFGKGRHPARLNLGDCFSYALAKQLGAPLLFKGDDFAQTDIASAM